MALGWHNIFIFLGAFQTLLMGLLPVLRGRFSHRATWSITFYLCSSLILLYTGLFVSHFFEFHPFFFQTQMPLYFLIGPTSLFMFELYTEDKVRQPRSYGLHLTLPVACLLLMLPYTLESNAEKLARFRVQLDMSIITGPKIFLFAASVSMLTYAAALLKKIAPMLRWESIRREPAPKGVLLALSALVVFLVCLLLTGLMQSTNFLAFGASYTAVIMIFFSIAGAQNPENLMRLQTSLSAAKEGYSFLKGLNLQDVRQQLEYLMVNEKEYRNEELSLAHMARRIGLSPHQLSEYLNQVEKKSFFHYLNGFRVAEACELLQQQPGLTVLDIAFRVGFNSKTAFNNAFKKTTNATPSEFRSGLNRGG